MGRKFGGEVVVAVSVGSLIFGYVIVVVAHHLENCLPLGLLLPKDSVWIAISSIAGAMVFLLHFCFAPVNSFPIQSGLLISLLLVIIVPMWLHPLRRRLQRWVVSNLSA